MGKPRHSCFLNCDVFRHENHNGMYQAELMAIRPLAKGEAITVNYLSEEAGMKTHASAHASEHSKSDT